MITTPSMGLKRWDQPNDIFSYTELSENFNLLDQHDHSPGKGVQVPTNGLANLAVTTPKIAAAAVDSTKLASNAVVAGKVASAAVSSGAFDSGLLNTLGMGTSRRGYAEVLTEQSTTSGTPGDLTTPGPSVTVTLTANSLVHIFAMCDLRSSVVGINSAVYFHYNSTLGDALMLNGGATTYNTYSIRPSGTGSTVPASGVTASAAMLTFCPSSSGSYTFALKYAGLGTGTSFFRNRRLWVKVEAY